MEKRAFLALLLSLAVLMFYSMFVVKPQPTVNQAVTANMQAESTQALTTSQAASEISIPNKTVPLVALEHYHLSSDKFDITFSNLGGNIEEIYLKDYNAHIMGSQFLAIEEFNNLVFSFEQDLNKAILTCQDSGVKIQKIFSFAPDSYMVNWELVITNLSPAPKNYNLHILHSLLDLSKLADARFRGSSQFLELSAALPDKINRGPINKGAFKNEASYVQQVVWLGTRDRYFCTLSQLRDVAQGYYTKPIGSQGVAIGFLVGPQELSDAPYRIKAYFYAGPQDTSILRSSNLGFEKIVNFGWFDAISKFILNVLKAMHKVIPNWGVCIIILSAIISVTMYPLTFKSLKSAKDMQALQPEMEALRKQYKDQPDKLNRELMGLYKKNKINPLGGCLPMLLQFPIFIALYQALLRSLDLRGGRFLWIKDLSLPDRLIILPTKISLIGNEINILPIIMALAMFAQQKMSAKSSAAVSPEQQKMMLILFPLMFGFMFYRFPSGLTLYWTCFTLLSLVLQKRLMTAK